MAINDEYFMLNAHMEAINTLIKNYLKPYNLEHLDYDALWSKLEEQNTKALKRMDSRAFAIGGTELAKNRIKLTEEYQAWKKANNYT